MVREVDGEIVILDTVSNRIHQLNATASAIWRACDPPASVGQIAAVLADLFDVGQHVATADAQAALEHFRALDLLRTEPGDQG
jgi:hypothetical protein